MTLLFVIVFGVGAIMLLIGGPFVFDNIGQALGRWCRRKWPDRYLNDAQRRWREENE